MRKPMLTLSLLLSFMLSSPTHCFSPMRLFLLAYWQWNRHRYILVRSNKSFVSGVVSDAQFPPRQLALPPHSTPLTAYRIAEGFFFSASSTDRIASLLRVRRVLAAAGGLGRASWRVSGQLAEKKSSFTAQNSA